MIPIGGQKMVKTVTAIKVRQNLGQVLNETYYRGDEFIVERSGKPIAAIVPIEEFKQWKKNRNLFFQSIHTIQERNKKVPLSKIEKDVAEAVRSVRASKSK